MPPHPGIARESRTCGPEMRASVREGLTLGWLRGHALTALSAAATSRDAFIHVAEALAIPGAFAADLRALRTSVLVVRRAYQHEVGAGPADFRARRHQAEMRRSHVIAPGFEAMSHSGRQADLVAAQAFFDAGLHLLGLVVHECSPLLFQLRYGAGPGQIAAQLPRRCSQARISPISRSCSRIISCAQRRVCSSRPCSRRIRATATAPSWCGIMLRTKSTSAFPE